MTAPGSDVFTWSADEPAPDIFGCMAGTVEIVGDVEAPVVPILLDTHAWLWLCLEPRRLSVAAAGANREALGGGGGTAVASISSGRWP